jgi:hypothetical protein
MPGIRIANIDREQWWSTTGGSETGVITRRPRSCEHDRRAAGTVVRKPRAEKSRWLRYWPGSMGATSSSSTRFALG